MDGSRHQHPTFYLPSDGTSTPVWASAATSLSVKQRIEELNAAQRRASVERERERELQTSPRPSSSPSSNRAASPASSGSLDTLPAPREKADGRTDAGRPSSAKRARRTLDLPLPVSVPAPQPARTPGEFADAGSNSGSSKFASPSTMSDGSDFQDAHSEGVS